MVGRATFGRPWIFKEIHDALHADDHQVDQVVPSEFVPHECRLETGCAQEQVRQSVERIDEYRGILHIRRHWLLPHSSRGFPTSAKTRIAMFALKTVDELFEIMGKVPDRSFAKLNILKIHWLDAAQCIPAY